MTKQTITPRFRLNMVTELTAFFLQWFGGQSDWLTILKLLYQVERRALEKYDWPITFDKIYRMDYGMVLSETYNLMKGDRKEPEWSEYIKSSSRHNTLELQKCPTIFYLSESQHNLAREVFEENKEKTGIQLSKESHEFPEWNDPMGSSNFLDYRELLQVLGKSNEEIERITEELRNETILENMLG